MDFTIKKALDFGCGVGRIVIPLAAAAQEVTGIDVSERNINIANIHSKKHNKKIKYYKVSSDDLIKEKREFFDVVTCLEVVEHVPDPKYLVQNCSDLLNQMVTCFYQLLTGIRVHLLLQFSELNTSLMCSRKEHMNIINFSSQVNWHLL